MNHIRNYQNALTIWKKMTAGHSANFLNMELDIAKKINSIFHVGPSYYYIFDVPNGQFLYVDSSIHKILGISPDELTVTDFMARIHPQDIVYFLNFENKVSEFFTQLSSAQVMKYKVSYDFRIKNADGIYIRILHQVITINHSDEGHVLQTLGVHTDITHIKNDGEPKLSFIGLEAEPSFIDVDYQKTFVYHLDKFSIREKEIIKHLCEGYTSSEIADILSISEHTVRTHRKNILRKSEAKSTTDLVSKAIKLGWV